MHPIYILNMVLLIAHQVNQKLGARLIAKMKHPVETAGNGQIAVDMILKDRSRYGLVLMDCQVRFSC
jgi:CheY-like chemotaxis protein